MQDGYHVTGYWRDSCGLYSIFDSAEHHENLESARRRIQELRARGAERLAIFPGGINDVPRSEAIETL
mgnify:CR=1 FL=1